MNITEGDRRPEIVDERGLAPHKPARNYANESRYQYGLKAGDVERLMADGPYSRCQSFNLRGHRPFAVFPE